LLGAHCIPSLHHKPRASPSALPGLQGCCWLAVGGLPGCWLAAQGFPVCWLAGDHYWLAAGFLLRVAGCLAALWPAPSPGCLWGCLWLAAGGIPCCWLAAGWLGAVLVTYWLLASLPLLLAASVVWLALMVALLSAPGGLTLFLVGVVVVSSWTVGSVGGLSPPSLPWGSLAWGAVVDPTPTAIVSLPLALATLDLVFSDLEFIKDRGFSSLITRPSMRSLARASPYRGPLWC
jgi:hypothetical protein